MWPLLILHQTSALAGKPPPLLQATQPPASVADAVESTVNCLHTMVKTLLCSTAARDTQDNPPLSLVCVCPLPVM